MFCEQPDLLDRRHRVDELGNVVTVLMSWIIVS